MARHPYHIARQEHLGDMLDDLQVHGVLSWLFEYDGARSRALYHVRVLPGDWRTLETRPAEELVQSKCDELAIVWKPVPHPGGEDRRAAVQAWIARETARRRRE